MNYYVNNDRGITQHVSRDLAECHRYIRNSQSLFGVRGLRVYVKSGKKFVLHEG